MMNKKLLATAALMAACIHAGAQTLATGYKDTGYGNPISGSVFCADPTALEYNGRMYVYGTNDHQQFLKNNKKGDNGYGDIKSLVVFSTADMVNWTFHGTIDVQKLCSTWSGNPWYKGFMNSWAPSVTWRHNEETGKDEFFLYFANTSHGVGVLTAESPVGPWKSPLKQSLINKDTPGALQHSANFDPGVVIDDEGTGWLTFGGLDPDNGGTTLMPNNTRIIKLQPSMTAVEGSALLIPAPYHFEANELNMIGGKYVFTYCSNWNRDNTEWNAYTSEQGITAPVPGVGTMCYMVADNPSDPSSWVYKGVYGPHPGTSGNNHSHLQKFKGNYYHIYHSGALLEAMKSAGDLSDAGGYRSLCVNQATVDEATQAISQVTLNLEGPEAVGTLNPYELQEAETMATCGGIGYEDFTNITKNSSISTMGNDASENMQVKMRGGSWFLLHDVDFGEGTSKLMLRAKGECNVVVRILRKNVKAVATFHVSSVEMSDYTVEVDASRFQDIKSIYFMATEGSEVYLDAWQAIGAQTDGIRQVETTPSAKASDGYYNISGQHIDPSAHNSGIIIHNGSKYIKR